MERTSSDDNTYIFDQESAPELARLINQDRFVTRDMGGPLVGLPELSSGTRILDLGCGPGGWVLDVAFEHPEFEVHGVDISRRIIEYAKTRASSQRLPNVSFEIMDITEPFAFEDHSMDLVNARLLTGVLKREAWQPFIAECTRVLRAGGILRLTEANESATSLSPAFEEFTSLLLQAMWRTGYGFSPSGRNWAMIAALPHLLRQAGYRDLHMLSYVCDYSASTEIWTDYYHNYAAIFRQIKPLLLALGLLTPEAFEQLYEQVLLEMHADDFTCVAQALTIWSYSPATH